ncbi:unnamed protein product [Dimorphilus gyrociliatus]|uniref:glycerophosphodiester phosphodiesterase n=1 Tax=Dimorphilus gyrociliatus TaxID=2664684 RepID=A0A7I8VTI1_9ANNE|nr:unnamed protein product [Dimorphilus gyrociliatus]
MRVLSSFLLIILSIINSMGSSDLDSKKPLVIAHRGASGELPEHTTAAYELAINQGADFIECDICLTKDLVPFCSHDCSLNSSTDISTRKDLKDRITKHDMDFDEPEFSMSEDYFSIDFTWDELKMVKVKQSRLDRDQSHNFKYSLCSLEEFLNVAKNSKKPTGVYPELKYPVWQKQQLKTQFKEKNTTYEQLIVDILYTNGFDSKSKRVFIQTFDKEAAKNLHKITDMPIIYLAWRNFDSSTVREAAEFAQGVGLWKNLIFHWGGYKNGTIKSTGLVKEAHDLKLKVHVYTFRVESKHVPFLFGNDIRREYDAYLNEKIDGFFTDYPYSLSSHLNYRYGEQCPKSEKSANFARRHMATYIIYAITAFVSLIINKY